MALPRADFDFSSGNKKTFPEMSLHRKESDFNIVSKKGNNSLTRHSSKPVKDPPNLRLEPLYPKKGLSKFSYPKVGLQILISSKESQETSSKIAKNIVLRTQMIKIKMSALYPFDSFLETCFYCKKRLDLARNDVYIYKGESSFCTVDCRERAIFADICGQVAAVENFKPDTSPISSKRTIFFAP